MGYQSGINQLLGIVAAGGYLVNKEYGPKLEAAKAQYTKAKETETKHFENIVEPASGILAKRQGPPSEAEILDKGLSEKELSLKGESGGLLGKVKGIKELEGKTNESYSNILERDKLISEAKRDIIMSKGFQEKRAKIQQQVDGNSHMQKVGQAKVKQRMTFNKFYKNLKDNPPVLNGDKNLFGRLGPEAQKQVAKQLYKGDKKK